MKPSFLLTVRKIGYKLVSSGAPAATSEDVAPALAEG
jgi:hypothetical protein